MHVNFWLGSVIAAAVMLGCGGPQEPSASAPREASDTVVGAKPKAVTGEYKVALLTPGPVSDAGWNALAMTGLKTVQGKFSATIANEVSSGTKIRESMRAYAQDGFQLIFGHGFEYNEPAMEVAKDFPNTVFVTSSGGGTASNVGAFRFYLEQGFYLAGILAADMSTTGKIATVGLAGIPSITSTFKAFEAGAKSVNPSIQVLTINLSSDKDIAAAKQATLTAIDQGADFVIHQANNAAQGVFDAAEERGAFAIGANSDQNRASEAVVASATIDARAAFTSVAERVRSGTFEGEIMLVGMETSAVDFVVSPAHAGRVPPATMQKIEDARRRIKAGELSVPKDTF